MSKFDPSKPVQTRDGRRARIICTDAEGGFPIIALVHVDNREACYMYYSDGHIQINRKDAVYDLVNIKTKKSGWVNIYSGFGEVRPHTGMYCYSTKEKADTAHSNRFDKKIERVDCIEIHWEE